MSGGEYNANAREDGIYAPPPVAFDPFGLPIALHSVLMQPAAEEIGRPRHRIAGAAAAARLLAGLANAPMERMVVLNLNVRNDVLSAFLVSQGGISECYVAPRDVFTPALVSGARSVIVAHNHPSGDPEVSDADVAATRKMLRAGILLGVEVLDHIIVVKGGRFSSIRAHHPNLWIDAKIEEEKANG